MSDDDGQWRDAPGFDGRYQATRDWRVRSCKPDGRVLELSGKSAIVTLVDDAGRKQSMTRKKASQLAWGEEAKGGAMQRGIRVADLAVADFALAWSPPPPGPPTDPITDGLIDAWGKAVAARLAAGWYDDKSRLDAAVDEAAHALIQRLRLAHGSYYLTPGRHVYTVVGGRLDHYGLGSGPTRNACDKHRVDAAVESVRASIAAGPRKFGRTQKKKEQTA